MVKQSRLRVQKEKKRRRALLSVLIIVVITTICWQINKKVGITAYLNEKILTVKKSLYGKSVLSRGTVYDRNLKQIAVTLERVSVYARTKEVDSIPGTVEVLGALLSIDKERLQKKLETGSLRVWIDEDISQEQEVAVKKKHLPGVYLQHEQVRFYPNDTYAAHIIGYVDDNIGLAGIEFFFDRLLANREVDGEPTGSHLNQSQDLVLTVDLKIQRILEDLVADIGGWQRDTKVAAYVMEGATGEIVGGAQYPGFNPNKFTQYSPQVLENNFLQPTVVPDKFRRLFRDVAGIYSILEAGSILYPWSIQPFETNLGRQLRLWEWLGMTEQWSTDFSAYDRAVKSREIVYKPFIHSQRQSYGLVPEYATPLKILTAMTGIFNDGTEVRPHVVAAISGKETGEEYHLPAPQGESRGYGRVIKGGAKEVGKLLRSQASQGSSGTLFLEDENVLVAQSAKGEQFLSSKMLLVLIPADTSPLTMLVVVEGPAEHPALKKRPTGQSLEKRVGQIVDRISVLQQVAKSVSDVVEIEIQDEDNYPVKKQDGTVVPGNLESQEKVKKAVGIMPDLKGLSLRRSFQLLQNKNVKIRFQGTGRVVSQKPLPGTPLKGLSECILILENVEDIELKK